MTILHGQFAIMLIVEVPTGLSASDSSHRLNEVARDFDLLVVVRLLPEQSLLVEIWAVFMISVHGADHPGIVASITGLIALLGWQHRRCCTRKN